MAMVYQWKDAASVAVDAQVAGVELERIRTFNNGRLEPASVVAASRKKTAPLHAAFEWSDPVAAEKYRLDQARYMIRSIVVMTDKAESDPVPTRAFVSVKRDEDRSYTSIAHALSDAELRAQLVEAAWAELDAWRNRHAELIELANIFAVIDQARGA